MAQILTVTGANIAFAPKSAVDVPATATYDENNVNEQVANLVIPQAGGLALTIWSGYSGSTKLLNPRGIEYANPGMFQTFPQSQAPQIATLSSQQNYQISMITGFYYDLAIYQMNFESYSTAPFFTAAARYFPKSGAVDSDGTIIWLHP